MSDATDGFPLDGISPAPTLALPVPGTPRASTSHVIADALRAAIVSGALAPGAPLRQDALAKHFSVSAIPVREALRQLESEGWTKVETHKGATVAPLSADEAREIYEIRSALESLAISLALPRHTDATLSEAARLYEAAREEPDPSLYGTRNEAFHLSLYAPAARPKLLDMIATLHQRGERYLRLKLGLPVYKDESDREHGALLELMCKRNLTEAQSLVTAHLLGTGDLLHRFLTEREQERAPAPAGRAPARKPRAPRARPTSGS